MKAVLPAPETLNYQKAEPFPCAVISGMWDEEALRKVSADVRAVTDWDGEKQFFGSQAKRWVSTWGKLPDSVCDLIHYCSQPDFLKWLEAVTGEKNLLPDPYLSGGGIHSIDTGGFLQMHADFNWHEQIGLYRRINLLVYLNEGWLDEWGGDLRLASNEKAGLDVSKVVFPRFNETVIFTTDDRSFHGHPDPITAPEGTKRNSIALYYYSPNKPAGSAAIKRTGTDYRDMGGQQMGKKTFMKRVKGKIKRALGV